MKLKLSLFFFFFLGFTTVLSAQNFQNLDLKNIDVDNLSQQQIKKISDAAQTRGLTNDQVTQLAIQRGMPSSEARKLKNRLSTYQSSNSSKTDYEQRSINRMRDAPVDSTQKEYFNRFNGVNSTLDSLKFDRSIARLKYQSRQDSIALAQRKIKNKVFGYSLFQKNKNAPFEPSLNIPTPSDYQLGAGDELIIDIYGAAEKTYQLKVSPDGMIVINNLGPINVNGLTIEEAKRRLQNRLGQIYSGLNTAGKNKDTYMQVSLGQIRSIKVSVIGEISKPGTYTLPSLATVFNAIYSAGGPTTTGSFRNIDIIRGDSVISSFDLYNLLVDGDQSGNIRLKDQDIIKINPYINRVQIKGRIKRPGIYELKPNETLNDLLTYAGRFKGNAFTQNIKVIGSTSREQRINDVAKSNFKNFKMHNGDYVNVSKILDRFKNIVQIKGAVFRPGKYELTDTTTVHSLITQANGLRGDAFENRGLIYRQQDDYTLKTLRFNVRNIIKHPGTNDITLKKNDLVVISSIFDLRENYFVKISGAVQDPGRYTFANNMSLQDLILRANGLSRDASPTRVEIARRVNNAGSKKFDPSQIADIYRFKVSENLKLGSKGSNFELKPFDQVYVRTSPGYQKQQEVYVAGQVKYPGTYSIKTKNDRISDIINRAGGLTKEAYAKGATLFRKIPELQSKASNKQGLYTQIVDSSNILPNQTTVKEETISQIGIQLPKILKKPESKYDFLVEKNDSLFVPKKLQTVLVKGGVFYPTSIRYDKDLTYKDYITAAGGYNDLARNNRSYIVYANGDVNRVKKFLFFKNYPDVRPGATLVVPERQQKKGLSPQERVGIYSAIVSTIAVISTTIFQIAR